MLAAGSFMHFVIAFVLLFVLAIGVGQPSSNTNASARSPPAFRPAHALASTDPCAATTWASRLRQMAGLRPGDKIIAVAGKPVHNWDQLGNGASRRSTGRQPVAV